MKSGRALDLFRRAFANGSDTWEKEESMCPGLPGHHGVNGWASYWNWEEIKGSILNMSKVICLLYV